MERILAELRALAKATDWTDIDDFAKHLAAFSEQKVVGLGAGRMGYSLRAFIMRLAHMQYDVSMIGDTNVKRLDQQSAVVVNSSSGETKSIRLYCEQAKDAGATLFTVTCNPQSSIGLMSDHIIAMPVIESGQPMKTVYEQFSLLLFDEIAFNIQQNLGKSFRDLEQTHSLLE